MASPFDMVAGSLQPHRGVDPGLVYDMDPDDNLCGLGYSAKELRNVHRDGALFVCSSNRVRLEYVKFHSFVADLQPEGIFLRICTYGDHVERRPIVITVGSEQFSRV